MHNENVFYRSKDVVWAIFLIFVGTIFLLNSTGLVGWGIWIFLLNFWPIFLILGGIKLIIGRSKIADIIISVVALIIFLVISIYSYLAYTGKPLSFLPGSVNECILNQCAFFSPMDQSTVTKEMVIEENQYSGVENRAIKLDIGAAYFEVSDISTENYLQISSKYPSNFREPILDSDFSANGNLNIEFKSASPRGLRPWSISSPQYELFIGHRDIPTNLDIVLGAGEGLLELSQLQVVDLRAKVGAGKLIIDLNEEALTSGEIVLEIGAGEVILNLPSNVAYELDYDLGVGQISSNREEISTFIGSGDGYRSENYDNSELKVKIVADVGVGSLSINNN